MLMSVIYQQLHKHVKCSKCYYQTVAKTVFRIFWFSVDSFAISD